MADDRACHGDSVLAGYASMATHSRRIWGIEVRHGMDAITTFFNQQERREHTDTMVTVTIQGEDWDEVQANAAEMFGTTYVQAPKTGRPGRQPKKGVPPPATDTFQAADTASAGTPVQQEPGPGTGEAPVSAAPVAPAAPDVVSIDTVKDVVKKYMAKHGLAKAAAIVQKITGKEKLAEAPESTYAALIAACNQEL